MATTEVHVERVDLRGHGEDQRGNRLVDCTVHFRIASKLGEHRIALEVNDALGFDWAVDDARKSLQKWATELAQSAQNWPRGAD